MRFIGNKTKLLKNIEKVLNKHVDGSEQEFIDLFAGSNSVGEYFANKYNIISNDILYFSYVLSRGTLGISSAPKFKNLDIDDPLKYLTSLSIEDYPGDFVTEQYSPVGKNKRQYFSKDNAKKIDLIRNTIEDWNIKNKINNDEYYYLLSSLISSIPSISNTTGTYGAYLKKWDKRAFKNIMLEQPVISSKNNNKQFNENSLKLIKKLKNSDIVYIDPPYNTRQYSSNYHVLEMIAKWTKPELKGITGQPNLDDEKSNFAVKRKAANEMKELLRNIDAKHVLISYSTDGIISEKDLVDIIKENAKEGKVEVNKFDYRKYKSKINNDKKLKELLIYYQPKNYQPKKNKKNNYYNISPIKESPKGFIKSPLNYIGGKYKLLPQIYTLFPKHVSTFFDMFSGGGNVGINAKANKIIFNDINTKVNDLFRYLKNNNSDFIVKQVENYIKNYNLSKTNELGFKKFRKDYNENPNPIALYTLVAYSFNYQIRFNNNMQYNNPFGKNRSSFSDNMKKNLIKFTDRLNSLNAEFTDDYFNNIDFSFLDKDSFIYADPPYLITTASYNDGKRGFGNWTEKEELELYDLLDKLNDKGIKFAMSNVLFHKGNENKLLKKWSNKYYVHHLKFSYSNSSYNTKHKESDEVLITNY